MNEKLQHKLYNSKYPEQIAEALNVAVELFISNKQVEQLLEARFFKRVKELVQSEDQFLVESCLNSLQKILINLSLESYIAVLCQSGLWQILRIDSTQMKQQSKSQFLNLFKIIVNRNTNKNHPLPYQLLYNRNLIQCPIVFRAFLMCTFQFGEDRSCHKHIFLSLINQYPQLSFFYWPPFSFYFVYEALSLRVLVAQKMPLEIGDCLSFFVQVWQKSKYNRLLFRLIFKWIICPYYKSQLVIKQLSKIINASKVHQISRAFKEIFFSEFISMELAYSFNQSKIQTPSFQRFKSQLQENKKLLKAMWTSSYKNQELKLKDYDCPQFIKKQLQQTKQFYKLQRKSNVQNQIFNSIITDLSLEKIELAVTLRPIFNAKLRSSFISFLQSNIQTIVFQNRLDLIQYILQNDLLSSKCKAKLLQLSIIQISSVIPSPGQDADKILRTIQRKSQDQFSWLNICNRLKLHQFNLNFQSQFQAQLILQEKGRSCNLIIKFGEIQVSRLGSYPLREVKELQTGIISINVHKFKLDQKLSHNFWRQIKRWKNPMSQLSSILQQIRSRMSVLKQQLND